MSSTTETQSPAKEKPSASNGGSGSGAGAGLTDDNVGKIRDILFGEQMEGYDSRFADLEQRLSGEIQSLQKAMENGFDQLRALVEKQTGAVSDAGVKRQQLADDLEQLASKLRGDG